jgi:hypothetical protein
MMTAGVGGLAAVIPKTPGLGIGLSALGGFGVGGVIQPAVTMLTIISPDESIGTISAASISARLTGATIGYAVYFNVLQNKLSQLPTNIGLTVIQAGLPTNETAAFVDSLLTHNKTALGEYSSAIVSLAQETVLETYVEGFRKVYLVSISFGICAFIACFFLKDIRKYMVDRVAVDIH